MNLRLLLFLIFFTTTLYAQQSGTVRGTVLHNDNSPAESVSILLKGTTYGTASNESGAFEITNVPEGKYTLVASQVGAQEIVIPVTIEANMVTSLPAFIIADKSEELKEVVVTGNRESYVETKVSQSLRLNAELLEVPQNISITTKQTLRDMGMLSKGEIARTSSGITRSYGGNLDMTLQIRGTNATYGTYRNGVGGPIWWNAQEDASMIERIEFVKGPAGFMLANAEPGGLVNTVTKQPTHARIGEVSFGIGSFNLMRTNIDLGGEVVKNGPLTYRLNTGVQKSNTYYDFGEFSRVFVCPALTYDFDKNTTLTLEHNYVKATAQENTHSSITINGDFNAIPLDMAINDPNYKPFLGADSYTRALLHHQFNDAWTLNIQAAYMTTDWDGTSMSLEGISPTKDTLYRASSFNDWWGELINGQIFLDGKFNTGGNFEHKVLIGIDYGDGGEGSTYGGTWGENKYPLLLSNPTYYLPKDSIEFTGEKFSWIATNRWMALYLQDHLKIFDKVILTLAGRFTTLTVGQDWNTPDDPDYEITDNKFTPRIGLTYMVRKNFSIYALHDESFVSQRGAIYGGGRLPPLTGSNNEIGVKSLFFDKQLSIMASYYDIRKNDVGTTDQLHEGFYLQTGQVRSTGFDFDINGSIGKNLVVNANYSYVDARITEDVDETLIGLTNNGTCNHLANMFVKYQVRNGVFKGIGVSAGMQYTGERSGVWPGWNSDGGNKYLPAYTLLDASLSYSKDKFYVGLNVYNITNKRYAESGSFYPDLEEWMFDVGTPVNFRLQTSIRF